MLDVLRIAGRNLSRYRRRTLLTLLLIVIGMVAVLLFIAVTGSFKTMMIGQFTDSVLGHLEVHRKGYVASIDTLPLNLNLNLRPAAVAKVDAALGQLDVVESWSPRVKFGAMFSNFTETTSIRVNGVDPAREAATVPLLPRRMIEGPEDGVLVGKGEIVIPVLLALGMKVGVGDTVVLVATNRDGSVNGKTFVIRSITEGISGPGGRDGYIHIDDARELLRMKEAEVSEIAIRLKDPAQLDRVTATLREALEGVTSAEGKPVLEVHTWADLSPFASLARMIDVMTVFIKIVLVSIVLVSVMNVMVMAVYERIREIGTIAAIGTPPARILSLFLGEGLLLGAIGTALGTLVSLALIYALNVWQIHFSFGQQQDLVMAPAIAAGQVATVAAMVVGVALLASLQPAWKASRLDPINALRHV
ncbi:ABC transporter permease [Aromatoleum bremense]|uniref:FtsX-like permease family protein n=1 Tax=Aromatoleum bremense TaxID=76115 RepID=A0ABX1NXV9_9RHOO|nr:ABC transporter permease [Aromatoleum bremense]NMG16873.1 FtsX-like permease family protein [Aromatoleum bremense]QTQ33279.1 ABC transporter permease protein domain-containing protein [Aromatoleum bremense]